MKKTNSQSTPRNTQMSGNERIINRPHRNDTAACNRSTHCSGTEKRQRRRYGFADPVSLCSRYRLRLCNKLSAPQEEIKKEYHPCGWHSFLKTNPNFNTNAPPFVRGCKKIITSISQQALMFLHIFSNILDSIFKTQIL